MQAPVYEPQKTLEMQAVSDTRVGKDHRFLQNYRPIGLHNTLAKVAEMPFISFFSLSAKIIPNEQFGFKEDHFTIHQLLRVIEHIVGGFNHAKHPDAVLLDWFKAFDKLWHNGLLHKLPNMERPLYLIQIIGSYLKLRTFQVSYNGALSAAQVATAGVL